MLSRSLLPLLFAGCVCVSAAAAEHTTDSLDEVKKRLAAEKAVLLDVREMSEWEEGRLKDAKLLPLSKVRKGVPDEELAKLMPQGKIVYAHCAAGVRCLEVADRRKKQG
jgi:phage shock protein E